MTEQAGHTGVQVPTFYEFGQPLRAADRCERCAAAAQVASLHMLPADPDGERRVVVLLWCGHHARQHQAKFADMETEVFDEHHILKGGSR